MSLYRSLPRYPQVDYVRRQQKSLTNKALTSVTKVFGLEVGGEQIIGP